MKHPDRVKAEQLTKQSEEHAAVADSYAKESHRWHGELGDAFSAASEAHRSLSTALSEKAKEFAESARTFGG